MNRWPRPTLPGCFRDGTGMLLNFVHTFKSAPGNMDQLTTEAVSYVQFIVNQGVIYHNYWSVFIDKLRPVLYMSGLLCDKDSLQVAGRASALAAPWARLQKLITSQVETEYFNCASTEDDHYCAHALPRSVTVMCDWIFGTTPVVCNACAGRVALYRFSPTVTAIELLGFWDRQFDHIYSCWSISADYEGWAASELRRVGSKLNRLGMRAAAALADGSGCDARYFLDRAGKTDTSCPVCGGPLAELDTLFPCAATCAKCKIVTTRRSG